MKVIKVRNVHEALPEALRALQLEGVERDSRNGPVLMFPEPVTTVYMAPAERVIFWPERDANPFFHLIESLWMLAGKNDVETVARYAANIRNYSDDGVTFHGAYGYRWRWHFGVDQLKSIVHALQENRDDRRQVLSMWDARSDLGFRGKDFPCNLQAVFQVAVDGRLDMTVMNRSNDMVWGAYGANAVHFSYLHEFVARSIGVPQGIYRQVSTNFHTYIAILPKVQNLVRYASDPMNRGVAAWSEDPYAYEDVEPFPLMSIPAKEWLEELDMFFLDPDALGFRDPFFRRVAIPMAQAHAAFKQVNDPNRFDEALSYLDRVQASDWKLAAKEWIERRRANFEAKSRKARAEDDGVTHE